MNYRLILGLCILGGLTACGKLQEAPNAVNDFKIGIFGANSGKTQLIDNAEVFYSEPVVDGEKTSVYNCTCRRWF